MHIQSETSVSLFDTKQKYQLVLDIVDIFMIREHNRIYIPAIGGFSDASLYLQQNVSVGDVGEKSLNYQIGLLGNDHVVKCNILRETINPLADVVIDSSVLDVFLAKPGLPINDAGCRWCETTIDSKRNFCLLQHEQSNNISQIERKNS